MEDISGNIMNLSDQFLAKAGGALQKIGEPADNTGQYSAFDDGGVECEVGEFLYGLVRILKPEKILTTGTYSGISDMYMAEGLAENGFGHITAVEYEYEHIKRATELWTKVGTAGFITSVCQNSLEYEPEGEYGLMFLDTEPAIRFQELLKFYRFLKPGGFVGVHDLHHHLSQHPNDKFFGWPFGELPGLLKRMLQRRELVPFYFPSPRGLTFFYKPKEGDFTW